VTAIQFYHLITTPLDRALPKLLEKAYAGGFRTLLVADSAERVEWLNQLLWTYDPNSFLPHGSKQDGRAEQQPILLSTALETDNNPNLLLVTNGLKPPKPEHYERILDMFDGNDPDAVAQARNRWTGYKNAGYSLSYLKQTQSGGWEQKAVA
jgi:DNA polymerase-3 subunit chi